LCRNKRRERERQRERERERERERKGKNIFILAVPPISSVFHSNFRNIFKKQKQSGMC
jgi:hypothetical protein